MDWDQRMRMLDALVRVAFATTMISLPFLLVNWFRYVRQVQADHSMRPDWAKGTIPAKSIMAFVLSIGIGMSAASISTDEACRRVMDFLGSASAIDAISINGKAFSTPHVLLQELRTLHQIPAHHTHPVGNIAIQVSTGTQCLELSLGRDSSNPREYWVFYPKYNVTAKNEIGRIQTSVLDGY